MFFIFPHHPPIDEPVTVRLHHVRSKLASFFFVIEAVLLFFLTAESE